jgi:hypothetical protein
MMVNRVWQYHFGRGLAGSPNNFGATGKKPTHPDLLDWLASEFMAKDWSVKELHRLIMTSETYRRASTHPDVDQLAKLDSSGKLPNGQTFASNAEFRKLVVAQDETFTRCLTKKLLTYAMGRQLNSGDRPSIDKISKEMANKDKGLRDLIQAVVASESFRRN